MLALDALDEAANQAPAGGRLAIRNIMPPIRPCRRDPLVGVDDVWSRQPEQLGVDGGNACDSLPAGARTRTSEAVTAQ